jgi:hypothetical protein
MPIKPYPLDWCRRLDFLPVLGLQAVAGDEDLELYYCSTSVSVKETSMPRIPRESKTEFEEIKVSPNLRNQIDYTMGRAEPNNGATPIPQREILGDIYNHLGGAMNILGENIADVVINSRGVVEKMPRELEEEKEFQGSENIFYHQNKYGNFPHKVRQAVGLMVANPYDFMPADLMEKGIIKSRNHPVLKKLRSTLKTEYLLTDATGYNTLRNDGILKFELAALRRKWWADVGQPTAFQVPLDHMGLEGQIYRLIRRNTIVAV